MCVSIELLYGIVSEINLWCPAFDNILEFFTCQIFHLSGAVAEDSNIFCQHPNFC